MENIQKIIGRAVIDKQFRETLATDPETALAEYNLTKEEIELLKGISDADFDSLSSDLEQRISRLTGGLGFGGWGGWTSS